MAGHSHSSNIRFRKDRVDAKRAKAFAKLSRMITVAARGGASLDGNAKLRLAVDKARLVSMPKEGIDRAIKKGAGGTDLGDYEEVVYEGYGPGGIALVVESLTDNRHRTTADLRMAFEKYGGNLGASGAVTFLFERRGRFVLAPQPPSTGKRGEAAAPLGEEALFALAIEVGADDLIREDDTFVIASAANAFAGVQTALLERGVALREAALAYVPVNRIEVDDATVAQRLLRLVDALEDNDDVQAVFSNETWSARVAEQLAAEADGS